MTHLTRRGFAIHAAIGAALAPLLPWTASARESLPAMTVSKDPNCGCCDGWVDYLRADGFTVDVIETSDLTAIKARLGVPEALHSCHTAQIGGYVIEGHVPSAPIRRLLKERPRATGLAVAGMPASSPGMDVPGATDAYDVTLFGPKLQRRYAHYQGRREIR